MEKLKLVTMDHDWLSPILSGRLRPDEFGLDIEWTSGLLRAPVDASLSGGEGSLGGHNIRIDNGDRSLVAIPVYTARGFRHRSYVVREDSPLHTLAELKGKTIGIGNWSATGNTWSREALREAGVRRGRPSRLRPSCRASGEDKHPLCQLAPNNAGLGSIAGGQDGGRRRP